MEKEKSKRITSRIKNKNRQQKEKYKLQKPDLKRIGNTRLRRISGKR